MTVGRNAGWTEEEFATLVRMLARNESMPAIARVFRRSQIDVAAKAFVARQSEPGSDRPRS